MVLAYPEAVEFESLDKLGNLEGVRVQGRPSGAAGDPLQRQRPETNS
jgi:hypothetical protein